MDELGCREYMQTMILDKEISTYAVKHKSFEIRMKSRSGGIFTALTDYVLEQSGMIYGCALDDNFLAIHKRAVDKDGRDGFRGSKYIQSNMNDTFHDVYTDLQSEKLVLFSGTSCQTEGLRRYLEVLHCKMDKLILVDIVCHGVPSPKVWSDYLKYTNKKYPGKIESVDFRNKKKYGWKDHVETITIDGVEHDSRIFTTLFYDHNILRPSCYKCPFKNINHSADITIADCWGIDKNMPEFTDNNGVSLVLVNTKKGKEIFEHASNDIISVSCDINDYLQPPLRYSFEKPANREKFWKYYSKQSFDKVVDKFVIRKNNSFMKRLKRKVHKIIMSVKNGK